MVVVALLWPRFTHIPGLSIPNYATSKTSKSPPTLSLHSYVSTSYMPGAVHLVYSWGRALILFPLFPLFFVWILFCVQQSCSANQCIESGDFWDFAFEWKILMNVLSSLLILSEYWWRAQGSYLIHSWSMISMVSSILQNE